MNKKNIDWENWEKNSQEKWAKIDLEKSKSGGISYIKEIDELITWKIYHAHWEDWLSSSPYFKNWREKINSFQTEKEINFYTSRLRAFMEFIQEHTRKDICFVENAKLWDPLTTPQLIEQELKRLENISEEEFNKTDKWKKSVGFKELSIEEMKNDPWFSKQLGFGSEDKKEKENKENSVKEVNNNNIDYKNWTKDQLISEIKRLKVENEELKRNKSLTNSEKQERLQKNQQKIDKMNSYYDVGSQSISQPNSSNDKFPIGWIIGGTILLAIGGLLTVLIYKNKKSKK